MRNKISFFIALQLLFLCQAHADDVTQGAAAYDWQTCLNNKFSECMDGCQYSHDPDCQSNCKSMSSDKCQAEGLSPTD